MSSTLSVYFKGPPRRVPCYVTEACGGTGMGLLPITLKHFDVPTAALFLCVVIGPACPLILVWLEAKRHNSMCDLLIQRNLSHSICIGWGKSVFDAADWRNWVRARQISKGTTVRPVPHLLAVSCVAEWAIIWCTCNYQRKVCLLYMPENTRFKSG